MNMLPIFLSALILCLPGGAVFADAPGQAGSGEGGGSVQNVNAAPADVRGLARKKKEQGDLFVSREEYGKAADEFVQALSLSSSVFSEQERLSMAITVSWAGRFDDSAGILRSILADEPKNRDARIHLAKVLSWSGKLIEAEGEADSLLAAYPEDPEALLVKANCLRWRGRPGASIPFYEKALKPAESFDARIGLAYAYLALNEKRVAQELAGALKPLYPGQERELAAFSDALCGVRASRIALPVSLYRDSEENHVRRAGLSFGFWAGKWDTELGYRMTDATAPEQHRTAEDLSIVTRRRSGELGASMGVGVNRSGSGSGTVITGQASIDAGMAWGFVAASVARDVMTDTAQLVANRIARASGTLSLSEPLTPRLALSQSVALSDYSDGNDARDVQLGARYSLTQAVPKIAAGYRFRYWDFSRQSGGGYFDPEGFTSHQVFIHLHLEKNGFSAIAEPYAGLQAFTRYGEYSSNSFYGAAASAGWALKKCTSFEITGEGGNYAGGTEAGFRYTQVGFRLVMFL